MVFKVCNSEGPRGLPGFLDTNSGSIKLAWITGTSVPLQLKNQAPLPTYNY
jgi:hypothetical protein